MIIWMDGLAVCKWSSERNNLLQIIIRTDLPLTNDDSDRPASCKWSFGSFGCLQMIFWNIPPLANDHLDGQASCKWSSRWTFSFSVALLLSKNIFLLQIFSSFSSAVNLFPWKKLFSVPNKFLIFLSQFCSPLKKRHLPSLNIIFLFHLRFISPQQKRISSLDIILFLLCSSFPL